MKRSSLPTACLDALKKHLRPDVFRALCDPQRLALLAHIATTPEPSTVTQASQCCDVHLSGASRHLALLREAGVLVGTKRGRQMVYQVDIQYLVRTLRGLADALEACCGSSTTGCEIAEPENEPEPEPEKENMR